MEKKKHYVQPDTKVVKIQRIKVHCGTAATEKDADDARAYNIDFDD